MARPSSPARQARRLARCPARPTRQPTRPERHLIRSAGPAR